MHWILFSVVFHNCIDDKIQRQKRERSRLWKERCLSEENVMDLNIEHQDQFSSFTFCYSCSFYIMQSLLLSEFWKINLISMNLKNRQHSCTFLKSLKHSLHTIPEDCREGLKELRYSSWQKIKLESGYFTSMGIKEGCLMHCNNCEEEVNDNSGSMGF